MDLKLVFAFAAVALLLLGCAGEGEKPKITPALPSAGAEKSASAAAPAKTAAQEESDMPPAPPSQQETPAAQEEKAAPAAEKEIPAPPEAQPAESQPAFEAKYGLLSVGQSVDFPDGKVVLEDVWMFHESMPALLAIKKGDGSIVKKMQVFEGLETNYTAPSGSKYWIYVSETQGGYDAALKRAKVYVLGAKESDGHFDRSLYSGILPEKKVESVASKELLGAEIAHDSLSTTKYDKERPGITAGVNFVHFDDLNKYPEGKKSAIFTVGPKGAPITSVKIPFGQAYVFSDGVNVYAVYNEVSGVGEFQPAAEGVPGGRRISGVRVYLSTDGKLQPGRFYSVGTAVQKTTPRFMETVSSMPGEAVSTNEAFSISNHDYGSLGNGDYFAEIFVEDSAGKQPDTMMISKNVPLKVKNVYGDSYYVWLESAGKSGITYSIYR